MRVFFIKEVFMNKYPMKLRPYLRPMIWGGNGIKNKYKKVTESDCIGESWELTCRKEAQSVIANGEYKGQRLCSVLGCGYDFPLLIKFIDACDRLSVQVHPDDNIRDENGTPLGKTEMWYIIDALEDSHIIYGLSDGVTLSDFHKNVEKGDFESGLRKVYVKPGDCFFIPAGQIHAIGKGILLAEVQQNSDTTYRLYDYGRLDKDGNPRELHLEKALSVIKNYSDNDIKSLQFSKGQTDNCLANCDKFSCYKYTRDCDSVISISETDSFTVLLFTDGTGEIICNDVSYKALGGDTYYIPEGISCCVKGNTTFLKIKSNKRSTENK